MSTLKPWAYDGGVGNRLDGQDSRLAVGALWTPEPTAIAPDLGRRSGIIAGGWDTAAATVGDLDAGQVRATQPTSGTVTVNPFQAVIQGTRSATEGAYGGGGIDQAATVDVLGGDGIATSLPRTDRIVFRMYDTAQGDAAPSGPRLQVVRGIPANGAPVPALPDDAIGLARVAVGANATVIRQSDITDERTFTVANGGVLPVRTKQEQAALPHGDGRQIIRLDTGVQSVSMDGTWWPIGRAGAATPYESTDVTDTTVFPQIVASFVTGKWGPLTPWNYTLTPSRDGWADVVLTGLFAAGTSGYSMCRMRVKRDGQLIGRTEGSTDLFFCDVVRGGAVYQQLQWRAPQRQLLREGVATTFSVDVWCDANGGGSCGFDRLEWLVEQA